MFKGSVCFLGKVAVCATDAGLTVLRSNHSFHVVVVSRDRLNTGSFICSVIQTQASNEIPAFDGVSGKERTDRPAGSIDCVLWIDVYKRQTL